jgi:shikimate dehydrogenase
MISMAARRYAVLGDPIGHSKSPLMHGAALRKLGLPHTYEAIRATAEDLPDLVAKLREGVFHGFNVTVPHKERVLALADEEDPSARLAGAANTLVRKNDGRVVAYNTDAPALAEEIAALLPPGRTLRGARALVLGSGGAARGAIVALGAILGAGEVVVRARSFADPVKRKAFEASAPCPVVAEPWEASADGEARTFALVQATSAGMRGADPGETVASVVAWDRLPLDAAAVDAVYAPRDTPWLRAARARGLRAADGLGMLARQGALALDLWLREGAGAPGDAAPLETMLEALER